MGDLTDEIFAAIEKKYAHGKRYAVPKKGCSMGLKRCSDACEDFKRRKDGTMYCGFGKYVRAGLCTHCGKTISIPYIKNGRMKCCGTKVEW